MTNPKTPKNIEVFGVFGVVHSTNDSSRTQFRNQLNQNLIYI